MAIPDNYIDKITKGNDSRMISPAADMVRVDNGNFDGETLDEVLDEVAQDISEAGSGAVSVTTNQDGTFVIHVGSTDYTVNLNHTHENMAKLVVCEESDLPSTLAKDTIYAQVDNDTNPTEIEKLWIAGLEFAGSGVPAGTPAITKPSGTTINLGENSGSGVSKTIEIKANSHITGDLTVGLAANSDLSFDTSNLPSGVTYNSGAGTLTIAQATAMQGVNITIVYSGSGAAEIDGGLIITGGGASPKSVVVVVVVVVPVDLAAVKLTGTQWLKTPYKPKSTTTVTMICRFEENEHTIINEQTNHGYYFMGCEQNSSNERFLFYAFKPSAGTYQLIGIVPSTPIKQITPVTNFLTDRSEFKASPGRMSFTPNGGTAQTVALGATPTMLKELEIGRGITTAFGTQIFNYYDLTIYELTIIEGSTTVHHYLPKSLEGVPGLYDTVTNTFISSETSDELVAIPLT